MALFRPARLLWRPLQWRQLRTVLDTDTDRAGLELRLNSLSLTTTLDRPDGLRLRFSDFRCHRLTQSASGPSADLTHAAGMRAVLRHPIDMCRDVHGKHPGEKASENLQGRMTTCRAVEVIPDNKQQYPSDKDADHVYVKP